MGRPRNTSRAFAARVVVLAVGSALLACGGGSDGGGPRVATELVVTPGGASLDTIFAKGGTVQLNASARDATGPIPGATFSFSSANQAIATVNGTGLVTAVDNGSTSITIASSGLTATRGVHVRQRFATLAVTPATVTLQPGGTRALTASPTDSRGNPIAGLGSAGFSTNNSAVATVNASGVVTAVANGNAIITASLTSPDGTREGTSTITVGSSFPSTATVTMGADSFSPTSVDITAGGSVTFVNNSGTTHNVTFGTLGANNISDHASGTNVRTFANAGNFGYQCTLHAGMNGTVIVH